MRESWKKGKVAMEGMEQVSRCGVMLYYEHETNATHTMFLREKLLSIAHLFQLGDGTS
jgi:hypothetical protein